MQPVSEFGRLYAVYGGVFIILSYLWGWGLDGDRPDKGATFLQLHGKAFHLSCSAPRGSIAKAAFMIMALHS